MKASMESECIPFREIPQTTKLFATFLDDFQRVAAFYAHPPTLAGIADAAREVRLDPAIRSGVARVLGEQNAAFGPGGKLDSGTARNLDRLAAGAVAIVSGQQVGLFSGPALSFYKVISIARCAEEMTQRGIDAVPVFWLATEDHDLAEVNHAFWSKRDGMVRLELPIPAGEEGRPAGEVALGGAIKDVVSQAVDGLEGEFAGEISAAVRESYTAGETFGSAFGKMVARLLEGRGIILLDSLDRRLHDFAAPVFRRALGEADSLRDALLARSKDLAEAGYHAQVKVTRETTLLFARMAGRREPVRSRNGTFALGDAELSARQLLEAMEKEPQMFSPSALLRPIVQDTLLPTAAYFGGPAEIAYWAQSEALYHRLLGRMPAVLPRASFTLIEQPIARLLAQYGLGFADILDGPQHVRSKMEQQALPQTLAARFDATEGKLRKEFEGYAEPIGKLDPTLVEALRHTQEKMLYQLGQFKGKVARAENLRTGVLTRHERALDDSLWPNGALQERSLCLLPFLAAHGRALLDELTRLAGVPSGADDAACARGHRTVFL